MITYFKGLLIIILLLILLPLLPREALAVDHVVRSVITVPFDWRGRVTSEQKTQYKIAIIQASKRVRSMYAQLLKGKTFVLSEDVAVEEILFPSLIVNSRMGMSSGFDFIGKNLFGIDKGTVIVYWIIGGVFNREGVGAVGGSFNPDHGVVWMPHRALLDIVSDEDSDQKRWALTALAHELGHAFGLDYAGFAKGHPCSVSSVNECLESAPQPYPTANEWASIMGYGTPYPNFPNLNFNNSVFNPEIQKLYQSPFINPEKDPGPEPHPELGVQDISRTFFPFEQANGPFVAGRKFYFPSKTFGNHPGKVEFFAPPDLIAALSPDDFEVQKWDADSIEVHLKESAESSTTQRKWRMRITTAEGKVFETSNDIIIQGKDFGKPKFVILTATLSTTCGEGKPVSAAVNFSGVSASGNVGTSAITDNLTGKGEVSLQIEDPKEGSAYRLEPLSLDGVPETPKEEVLTLESADIQAGHKIVNINIHYPSCPATKDSQPTPIPTPEETVSPTPSVTAQPGSIYTLAPVPTPMPTAGITEPTPAASIPVETPVATPENATEPTPTTRLSPIPTSIPEPTQVLISNYSDFRGDNAPGDAGSPTVTINNPSGQTITWKLSTLIPSATRRVFVRVITGDEYKDYEPLEMRDGEVISVAGINIQAKMIKKVVRMTVTVGGQEQEVDINNPQEIITRLPGNAGQAQRFSLPFVIEYSDGEVVRSAIGINYQPQAGGQAAPVASASLVPLPSAAAQPTAEPSVSSAPSCGDFTFRYNECFACNKSRKVLQDGCGQFDNSEINPGVDPACASWCSTSPSPETRKEIIRITINEQEIDPAEFYSGFSLNLPGKAGQPQTFSIPVVVYYSDDTKRNFAYIFNYQPSNQQPCLYEYKYPECDPKGPGWVHEVWQNCEGKYDFRNIQFQARVCGDSGQQPSPQEDSCLEDRSDKYPQCGGTAGLEDKDPTHTYLITRVKDCQGNILRYEQEDLGDQGQCQN